MIQLLLSALLVLVVIGVATFMYIRTLKRKPTHLKITFGKWFTIESDFEAKTSKTR